MIPGLANFQSLSTTEILQTDICVKTHLSEEVLCINYDTLISCVTEPLSANSQKYLY